MMTQEVSAARVTVLGSGSSGNATLLQVNGRGLLIDCGFGPRDLATRLGTLGLSWANVNAVLLTHTHGDHWNRHTLEQLRRSNIPLVAHAIHHAVLAGCEEYAPLKKAKLVHAYGPAAFNLGGVLRVEPIEVSHDSEPTFAFRIGQTLADGRAWSYGHASDLGCVSDALLRHFHGVDALALEFNHDVQLERASRRPRHLIHRVLSDSGHLSNAQAGQVLKAWIEAGDPGDLQAVIALHLSRECNRPELALAAAAAAAPAATITVAKQDSPTPTFDIIPRAAKAPSNRVPTLQRSAPQPTLLEAVAQQAG